MKNLASALAEDEASYIDVQAVGEVPRLSRASSLYKQFKSTSNIYLKPVAGNGKTWHDEEGIKTGLYNEPWYFGGLPRDHAERLVLDQPKGNFLVRASVNRKGRKYAITVAMGNHQFLHIAVNLKDDGSCMVDKTLFSNLKDVVSHYKRFAYNDIVMLKDSIDQNKKQKPQLPPNHPPARKQPSAPKPPPRITVDGGGYTIANIANLDFESDHIYSCALSSDEEDEEEDPESTYLTPDAAMASLTITRGDSASSLDKNVRNKLAKSIKVGPLPGDVRSWSAAEVQRFLKESRD